MVVNGMVLTLMQCYLRWLIFDALTQVKIEKIQPEWVYSDIV